MDKKGIMVRNIACKYFAVKFLVKKTQFSEIIYNFK